LEYCEYVDDEPKQIPKWAQTTLQEVGEVVGDLVDWRRTRSKFEDPPHALETTKPMIIMHF
jgi:hypothetical protein